MIDATFSENMQNQSESVGRKQFESNSRARKQTTWREESSGNAKTVSVMSQEADKRDEKNREKQNL